MTKMCSVGAIGQVSLPTLVRGLMAMAMAMAWLYTLP